MSVSIAICLNDKLINSLVHFYKRCVSGLRCPNICSIFSKVNEDQFSLIFLLMEYSDGMVVSQTLVFWLWG